jgi:hypothetical protein
MRLPDNTKFRVRDQRKPNHHWADNEVLDDLAPRIGAFGYAVYMFICRWAGNDNGCCTKSQREIANAFGISTDTVARAVQKLIKAKLLTKQDEPGRPSEFIVLEVPKRFQKPAAHSGTHLPPTAERPPHTAAHLPPTAAPNKEVKLSQDFSQDLGASRPAWGIAWTIAQKHFWDEFERQAPQPESSIANASIASTSISNPDAERFQRFRAAANRVGLSATQAKRILLEHPTWKNWRYTADLDSRQEITFPEPEKPKPAVAQALFPQTWVAETSPESEARAKAVWEHVNDFVKARISANSYSTWVKPLRAVALSDGMLIVRIPTHEFKHVGEKFGELIRQAIADPRNTGQRNTDPRNLDLQNQVRATSVKFVTQEEIAAYPRARSA